MKAIFAVVLITAYASGAYAQTEGPKGPLIQLIDDVNAAIPRAHMSRAQRSQLNADKATLEATRQARLQGQSVNRIKAGEALKDIQNIVDSGAFDPIDQQNIDADVQAVRNA